MRIDINGVKGRQRQAGCGHETVRSGRILANAHQRTTGSPSKTARLPPRRSWDAFITLIHERVAAELSAEQFGRPLPPHLAALRPAWAAATRPLPSKPPSDDSTTTTTIAWPAITAAQLPPAQREACRAVCQAFSSAGQAATGLPPSTALPDANHLHPCLVQTLHLIQEPLRESPSASGSFS